MPSDDLYIGLMSGTSIDGIDAALVQFTGTEHRVLDYQCSPWPPSLGTQLRAISTSEKTTLEDLGTLDTLVADAFAESVLHLLKQNSLPNHRIRAIGSHGQTIRHRPDQAHPFSLQIGDPNRIAEKTGISVVADFRRRDIAAGGQGAPLAPAFHVFAFSNPKEHRVVANIGGIANITVLPANSEAEFVGFDTGPGNTLMNAWAQDQLGEQYDDAGRWAAEGVVDNKLLNELFSDPYFCANIPKSTGPEYFNLAWLEGYLPKRKLLSEDIQATLTALTARSLSTDIRRYAPECATLIICGGGVHNLSLMRMLQEELPEVNVSSSTVFGVDPEEVEAIAFAWLAKRALDGLSGNIPSVTGADHPVVLGGIYQASHYNDP